MGKSKFYDSTATQEIEKEAEEDEGSFFAGGPGAEEEEERASSAEASPGPVKRTSADSTFTQGPDTIPDKGMNDLVKAISTFGTMGSCDK